jgi:hypothetical protein
MGLVVRTIGLARARVKIGLANLVYNMKQLVWPTTGPVIGWPERGGVGSHSPTDLSKPTLCRPRIPASGPPLPLSDRLIPPRLWADASCRLWVMERLWFSHMCQHKGALVLQP